MLVNPVTGMSISDMFLSDIKLFFADDILSINAVKIGSNWHSNFGDLFFVFFVTIEKISQGLRFRS
jgi:hypothetical protein